MYTFLSIMCSAVYSPLSLRYGNREMIDIIIIRIFRYFGNRREVRPCRFVSLPYSLFRDSKQVFCPSVEDDVLCNCVQFQFAGLT